MRRWGGASILYRRRLIDSPSYTLNHEEVGKALEEGMIEFRQAALLKVARGDTSIEEVFRAVPSEYLGLDD